MGAILKAFSPVAMLGSMFKGPPKPKPEPTPAAAPTQPNTAKPQVASQVQAMPKSLIGEQFSTTRKSLLGA